MAKKAKFKAKEKCYYVGHLFEEGESLDPSIEPNEYFIPIDEDLPEDGAAVTPADDKRSTDEMVEILEKKFKVKIPAGTPRKAIWKQLTTLELKGKPLPKSTAGKSKPPALSDQDRAKLKAFGDMTPDELDNMKLKDISEHCAKKYGKELKYVGIARPKLIEAVLKIESKAGTLKGQHGAGKAANN